MPTKPPIGLKPRKLIDEDRLIDIIKVLFEYTDNRLSVPIEWVEEYNEITERMRNDIKRIENS